MQKKTGKVVSTKMQKTAVISVESKHRHPIYKKSFTRHKKFFVNDPTEKLAEGDVVEIAETTPISKNKCWKIENIIRKANK